MSLKAIAARIFAGKVVSRTKKWSRSPFLVQDRVFNHLIAQGKATLFGKDHDFKGISNHADYVKRVPIRDYEDLKGYVDKVVSGDNDILWPGKPLYFAKTSGTTSGTKYIPITKASIGYQIAASRDAILHYIHRSGKADFVDGRWIFLQGSPDLKEQNGIKLGRLSGISAHYVPSYLQKNRLPCWETNRIADWETKVAAIVEETVNEDMTLIAGIPSWVQMYFEKLTERSGTTVGELFPNFQVFIYGGVNYEPYRARFERLIGRKVDSIELFPASEGFFAYQDASEKEGMLLLLNSGIFYEFIPVANFSDPEAKRLTLRQVILGVNYVMIISTNAGLWAYNLGDTIQFISLNPFRIVVTGRLQHFISAFGEHVIAKEVEEALSKAIAASDARVNEFTVAPQINPEGQGLPYHEWFIEFEKQPSDMPRFIRELDDALQEQNTYYYDLIQGKVLQLLKVRCIRENGFRDYMKHIGKLGGQNKIKRLSNDRQMAEELTSYTVS